MSTTVSVRATIYCRVSRQEQLDGYSIEAQQEACRKLCADRGWTVVLDLVEPGESGKNFEQRETWQQVMQAARAKQFDVLVSHKIDRFSRSTILDSLHTLEDLRKIGISFVSASEPIDFTTSHGELTLVLFLWFARHYLINLSAEVTKGRRKRAESGKSNANRPPFGYLRNADGDDLPDDATYAFAVSAYEQYASGATTDGVIAAWLNDNGARTLDGRRFTAGAVRELLVNPFYAGFVRYRGIREALTNNRAKRADARIILGVHAPIISRELFDRAQAVRTARAGKRTGRAVGQKRVYLLQDLAHCAACGGRMKCSHTNDGRLRYSCNANDRGDHCEQSGRTVVEAVLMPQIERMIAGLRIPDNVLKRAAEIAQAVDQGDPAQVRRAEIVGEMKRLDYLFQKGRKPQDAYDKEMARLEAELLLLEPTERKSTAETGAALADLIGAWHAARDNRAAKHDILRALLESVEVDAPTKRITRWQPRPDFVALFGSVTKVGATGLAPQSVTRRTPRRSQRPAS